MAITFDGILINFACKLKLLFFISLLNIQNQSGNGVSMLWLYSDDNFYI